MIITLNWEGTRVIPQGQLVRFCIAGLSHLVEGVPPVKTLTLPIRFRAGPMMIPDITPPFTPALSPMVMGIMVVMLCAGIMEIRCFSDAVGGIAIGNCPMLG